MESNTRLMKLWHGTDHWEGGIVIPFCGYRIRIGGKKVTTYREVTASMSTMMEIPPTYKKMEGKKFYKSLGGITPMDINKSKA